jgi:hypothetical protein
MTRSKILAAGIAACLGLGLAAGLAYAHQGEGCGGMGTGAMAGTNDGTACGMGAGYMAGMKHGMGGGMGGPMAGQQLMTAEERAALRDKMHNAATAEERQQLAAANHAEMQRRAAERGIALPSQCAQGKGWQSH